MSKDLTDQQKLFLETFFQAMMDGQKRSDASKMAHSVAGYSEATQPSVILAKLKDALIKRSEEELAMVLPKTVRELEGILDNPMQDGTKASLAAIQLIMDRAGLVKNEKQEITVKQPEGLIVMPAKNPDQ